MAKLVPIVAALLFLVSCLEPGPDSASGEESLVQLDASVVADASVLDAPVCAECACPMCAAPVVPARSAMPMRRQRRCRCAWRRAPRATSPATSATATIVIQGTNGTIMPCSQTGTLRERYHTITINAQIAYLDAAGVRHVVPYVVTRTYEQPAGGGNGFAFTFQITLEGASSIQAISANGRVETLQVYGIHGWLTLFNDATGVASAPSLTITTRRSGNRCEVSGLTSGFGLLPHWEDRLPVATVPPPPPPSQCGGLTGYVHRCCTCCERAIPLGARGYDAYTNPILPNRCSCPGAPAGTCSSP